MRLRELSLRQDPDLRQELASLARGCDFVLPSRFKKRLKAFQQVRSVGRLPCVWLRGSRLVPRPATRGVLIFPGPPPRVCPCSSQNSSHHADKTAPAASAVAGERPLQRAPPSPARGTHRTPRKLTSGVRAGVVRREGRGARRGPSR